MAHQRAWRSAWDLATPLIRDELAAIVATGRQAALTTVGEVVGMDGKARKTPA